MSQSRQEQDAGEVEEKLSQELEAAEKELEEPNAEEPSTSLSLCPQTTSSTEQAQKQDNWLWGWLPLPLLTGLTWLGDRSRSLQEPVCCRLERKRSSGKMCPECEIMFCKKCEKLHYSRAFIEHGLLGHNTETAPVGIASPVLSSGSIDLAAAPEEMEDGELKRL